MAVPTPPKQRIVRNGQVIMDTMDEANRPKTTGTVSAVTKPNGTRTEYPTPPQPTQAARPIPTAKPPIPQPQNVPTPYASLDYERAQRERNMNAAIGQLNTDYSRMNTNIQQDRVLENGMLGRQLNPFSGRSGYAWGMVNMERARTDRERQEDLANREAAIRGGYTDFVNAMPALERERQDALMRDDRDYGLRYAQQFDTLPGYPTPGLNGMLPVNFTGGANGNVGSFSQPITGAGRDRLFDQQQKLRDFAQKQSEAYGVFIPDNVRPMVDQLLNIKRAAEQQGVSQAQMSAYGQQANAIRDQLMRMGYDADQFGSGVNYNQAVRNVGSVFRTMDQRDKDFDNNLDQVELMADLTGYLPDGSPTTAYQKQQLEQAWKFAEEMGVIGADLGQLYGIPANTPTWAAQQDIIDNKIAERNAATSEKNAETSRMNANLSQTKYNDGNNEKTFQAEVVSGITQFESAEEAQAWLNANAGEITKQLGSNAIVDLQDVVDTIYGPKSEDNSQKLREKAIDMATLDLRWNKQGESKESLIKEYQKFLTGK